MRGVETSSLSSLGHSLLKKQRWRLVAILCFFAFRNIYTRFR